MKQANTKFFLNLIILASLAVSATATAQGFDLMNMQSSDKLASSAHYIVTNSGIEQFSPTSINRPFAVVTSDTFYVTKEQKTTSVEDGGTMPTTSSLQQNYPNPFNNATVIRYSVNEASTVNITVYDLTGREVTTLVKGEKQSGTFSVGFSNVEIASGTYLYRMVAKNNSGKTTVETKKMIVMK